ncbi:MAG: repeat containing protein [Clostridiales bacterium]|nr:repeat containing protein [Clostridiales bacterium]
MGQDKLIFYTMFHPFHGFDDLKRKKSGSVVLSNVILVIFFISAILNRQLTGFIFNPYRIDKLNVLTLLPGTIILFAVWVICNWAFCSLLDGSGTFKEIWIVSAYSLVPYILFTSITIFLSNFITIEGAVFLNWIFKIGQVWSIILIILGLREIHQYTLKKTLMSIVLTIVGILIVVFLTLLSFSLYNQVATFIKTIYREIIYRL